MPISNKKQSSRISKMKNIAHIRAFIHLPHFLQDLFWHLLDGVMVPTSFFFFKKSIWDPPCSVKVLTSLKNRKTRANKIFLEKIWNRITQKNQSLFYRKKNTSTYNDYKKHIHIENFCKYTLIWKFLNFVHISKLLYICPFLKKNLLYIHVIENIL